MAHEIRVPVGLEERLVTITVDPESGKASIRIDGRMAGRPLGAEEDRRELRIGDDIYELRREWDQFDLEYVGPAEVPVTSNVSRAAATPPAAHVARPSSFPVGKALLAVVVMAVGGWLYRPIAEVVVDWTQFESPDQSFAADMPGQVVEAKLGSFAKTAGARAWVAERNGKIFEIGFVEIPPEIRPGWENEFINNVRDSIAKKYKGNVVNDEDWPGGTELMIACDAWRNTSDGPTEPRDVRLRIMIRGNRVVIAAASAPPREIMSMAVTRFFMSVRS